MGDTVLGDKLNERFSSFIFEITAECLGSHTDLIGHFGETYSASKALADEIIDDIKSGCVLWFGLENDMFGIE